MSEKQTLVSIIIPIFNASDFILNTLILLEAQTYNNYEIILVNDGSTDNTLDVLENYKSDKINITIYSQKNSGVSAARNKGIELAHGDFIVFLDSDDNYSPSFLEKMLAKQKEKDANIVYCGFNHVGRSGRSTVIHNYFMEDNVIYYFLQRNGYFHLSCLLIRKSILVENFIYFDVNFNLGEDLLFTVKLLNNFDCSCVKDYLFNYVQRSGSVMTSSWSKHKWISDISTRKQILSYLIFNYHKINKKELINLASAFVFQREISYLIDCIKKMKYKEIYLYLNKTNFLDKEYLLQQNHLNYKDRKKFLIIRKKNRVAWFIYTLYYRFFRFNL